jgi:hypothetical protein
MIHSISKKIAYIGSTTLHVKTRISNHLSSFRKGYCKCSSIDVLKCDDYQVVTLEKCDEDMVTIKELKNKEKLYIEKYRDMGYNVVNKNVPNRSSLEYYYDNRDQLLDKQKQKYDTDGGFRQKISNAAKARYAMVQEFKRMGHAVKAFDN